HSAQRDARSFPTRRSSDLVTSGSAPFVLPAGFPVQSKPGPGKQPQTFELDGDTLVGGPAAVGADPVSTGVLAGADGRSVLLNGRSEEHTSELQSPCKLVCR